MLYILEGTKNETRFEAILSIQEAFTDYWGKHDQDYSEYDIEIYYIAQSSVGTENQKVVANDIPVFFGAMLLMLVYISLTLGNKLNCVESRIWLGLSSVMIMILAMIISIGIGSMFGVAINTLMPLIPFILLGVGVDDQIIVVETLNTIAPPNKSLEQPPQSPSSYDHARNEKFDNSQNTRELDRLLEAERLSIALQHSGLSISLTSFASVVAFAVGSLSDMPAIHSFCSFSALAFLANYGMYCT